MAIPLEGEAILCSGQACHKWSRFKSKIKEIRILPEVGEVSGVEYNIADQMNFKDLFKEIGIIVELIFPYEIYKKLEGIFPEAEKKNVEGLLYKLRMQKTENEIACIKKAGEIISNTFEYAVSKIKPGVTELDIQAEIEGQILRLGAESYCNSFAPMIPNIVKNIL